VIFLPDRNLAINSARKAGKNILFPDTDAKGELNNVEMIGWQGACEVHERFLVDDIRNAREQYPGIKVLTHPESPPEVAEQVDYCGGTTGMMKYVAQSEATRFLIMTECSMTGILQAAHPDREFISMCSIRCPHMNRITMERVLEALEHGQFDVQVETTIAQRARKAVERMIEIG
jgi:quinolinate synthase